MADPVTPTRPGKGWWTLIAGLLTVVVGQLMTWDWISLIPDQTWAGRIVTGLGLLFTLLRFITNTPVATGKALSLLAICMLALTLAACDPSAFWAQVKTGIETSCGILVTGAKLASLYPDPKVITVSEAVTEFCNMATSLPAPTARVAMAKKHGVDLNWKVVDPAKFQQWKAAHPK